MERAPSRAKAANILRPASRAQDVSTAHTSAASPTGQGVAGVQQQPMRVLPNGVRLISPAPGAQPVFASMQPPSAGILRRAPSAAHFHALPPQQMGYATPDHQQPPLSAGGSRQRVSSYYEGMPMGDFSAMPRSVSRSGSRADLGPMAASQQQQQQQPQRSSSRAGGGGMWPGQMGMNNLFGGGFGTMGVSAAPMGMDAHGPMSPITPQYYAVPQTPGAMGGSGSRPGSSLQHTHPARPATSTGFRSLAAESDSPKLVNVARGGARVIGPMRAKNAPADAPSFLNPIPQSPSSALGSTLPGAPDIDAARDHVRSALSNNSLESARSRSNSALHPTEESMEAAEARVSRKIQDLEISNKSLLAVNAQLESRVKSQREQISELKKQLQLKTPYLPDISADSEVSDEALRSALKEDKVFERLLLNLEHLIQDAKSALEYRSTIAAGKVISATELNEDNSQVTASGEVENPDSQEAPSDLVPPDRTDSADTPADTAESEDQDSAVSKSEKIEPSSNAVDDAKMQEARELVARLMVLALSSPEPPTPEKPTSRIPKRSGSATTPTAARTAAAGKNNQRTPVKAPGSRISSFGVASTSTPVRSVAVSPTPSSSKNSVTSSKEPTSAASEKEQILDICRKLQEIL
ncbi:hypothetical protein H4R22_000546 [Coemansia sp. RSA 1290]|nr:hypothetical protein H4R22_000546 [Coemansia sp. RSA 1290]KAJ2647792.1 hypothetical protein IWW40_004414 [Coemansia sp. RSA 1250]